MKKEGFMIGFLLVALLCFAYTAMHPSASDPPQTEETVIDQSDADQVTLQSLSVEGTLLNAVEVEISYGDYTVQTIIKNEGLVVNNEEAVQLFEKPIRHYAFQDGIKGILTAQENGDSDLLVKGWKEDYSNYLFNSESTLRTYLELVCQDFDYSMNKLLVNSCQNVVI